VIRFITVTNPIEPSRDPKVSQIDFVAPQSLDALLLEEFVFHGGEPAAFDVWTSSVTVSVNGHVWARSLWDQVIPRDGDTIVILPIVAGGSILRTLASVALLAGTIALAATGVGAAFAGFLGGVLGTTITAAVGTSILVGAASIAGNLLISALLGPNQPSAKTNSASYDPDGPRSLAQSGVVIPKGYGKFQWGGNIIDSFTEVAGEDVFINVLVCFGFGPARSMTNIQINGKNITDYQNVQTFMRLGTNDQTEIAQFNQIVNGYGQAYECLAGVPVIVPGTGDLTQAIQVDIAFPNGVFVLTADGNTIPAVITYLLEYSVSGLNDWIPVIVPQTTLPVVSLNPDGSAYLSYSWGVIATDLAANSNVVYTSDNGPHSPGDPWTGTVVCEVFQPNGNHTTYNKPATGEWQLLDINMNYVIVTEWSAGYQDFVACDTAPLYNRTNILGLAPGKYDVRITKYGSARLHDDVEFGDNNSPNVGQDVYVHSVNEVSYLPLNYPNMILLGVRALATSQLSGSSLNVTALITHGLRTLDEGLMPAQLLTYEEDNPALVAADMALDPLYGGGAYPGIIAGNIERFIDEWVAWADLNDTLVPEGYPVAPPNQPDSQARSSSYMLQSTGPGSTTPGNVATIYYSDSTTAGPDPDLEEAWAAGPVYLRVSFVDPYNTGPQNFGPVIVQVLGIGLGSPPGQPRQFYYFTFAFGTTPDYFIVDAAGYPLDTVYYQRQIGEQTVLVSNSIRLHVFNGIFDNEDNLWNQLVRVGNMSRAAIIPMGQDYGVMVDQLVDAPVQMFTMGNILQDSFTETWLNIDDRANQVEIQFADATRYYRSDNPLIYMDPAQQDLGVTIKNTRIKALGVTAPAQAWHLARYKERCNQLLLRTGSFRTDTDGIACRAGNVIALQHDVPQWGWGGRTLPGSTTTNILVDRFDIPFVTGTAYSLMVQHSSVQRFAGTVSAVATSTNPPGFTLTVVGWTDATRITRCILTPTGGAATDCLVLSSSAGTVTVSPPPGFTPAAGAAAVLFDTDVLESVGVSSVDATTGALVLSTPLAQAPDDYGMYIYGPTGAVKLAKVSKITKASEFRSTIEWIDYAPDVYTVATPIIGETSAQQTTSPGVTNLKGTESQQLVAGTYATFVNLAWTPSSDTAGVSIYVDYPNSPSGAMAKLAARIVGSATTWNQQVTPGVEIIYTVVGFDPSGNFASFTTAPTVTFSPQGVAKNLLKGSSFASGFTYWNIAQRAGDTFLPDFSNDGEAVYTVAATALTTPLTFLNQIVPASSWAVGDLLMLSGYAEDTAAVAGSPNVGNLVLSIVFTGSSGVISSTTVADALSGVTPSLTRYNTAAVAVPTGTLQVSVTASFAGTGLSLPVASTVTLSHLLLETATTGQTVPSEWADVDVSGQILDLFTTGSSTGLRVQGSVLPSYTGSITYTSDDASVTLSWTSLIILWPDGSYTTIQDGSMVITGLTAATTYFAFLYFDIVNGGIKAALPLTPLGAPAIFSATFDTNADAFCKQDNKVPLTPGGYQITTASSGSTGTGTSGGGGTGSTGGNNGTGDSGGGGSDPQPPMLQ